MEYKLVEPTYDWEMALLQMAMDYSNAGEDRYSEALVSDFQFTEYVNRLQQFSKGINLDKGFIPSTTYWLVDENEILGVCRFRHRLNENLEKEGGHIGYDVPPSKRGNGYATLLLKLTLEKMKEFKLDKVLITCNKDNYASARVIQKNDGVLENEVVSDHTGKFVSRYWISLNEKK